MRLLNRLLGLLVLSSLVSCQTKIPDVPVCVELSPIHGHCVYIVSGEHKTIDDHNKLNDKTWWEIRTSMIQVPAQSWKELKAFIIKSCKKYGNCDKEISSWDKSVDIIDTQLATKAPENAIP